MPSEKDIDHKGKSLCFLRKHSLGVFHPVIAQKPLCDFDNLSTKSLRAKPPLTLGLGNT